MSKHWEAEFWGLLSPGTILRLKAELGIGPTTDATPRRDVPSEPSGDIQASPHRVAALPTERPEWVQAFLAPNKFPIGTLVQLKRNSDIVGVTQKPNEYTGQGEVAVRWDDRPDDVYNIQVSELEVV